MALRLLLALAILGTTSPWLLLMLPCAAFQLFLDRRGQARERRSELDLAEDKRIQDHLFDLCLSASAGQEIRSPAAAPELLSLRLGAPSTRHRRPPRPQPVPHPPVDP
jgi:ATP-binding cassette subfamily B protein